MIRRSRDRGKKSFADGITPANETVRSHPPLIYCEYD